MNKYQNFREIAEKQTFSSELEILLFSENFDLCISFDISQLQSSSSWRNLHIAREIANLLINESGKFNTDLCHHIIPLLEKHLYSLGPDREHDHIGLVHILNILHLFLKQTELIHAIQHISKPEGNVSISCLVRESLGLSATSAITDIITRKAVLSALLTRLRQNVGSCFATAPAIMIQQEQPLQFLHDITQLISQGRLGRIYDGVEFTVPMSYNFGSGDLHKMVSVSTLGNNPRSTLSNSPGLQAAWLATGLLNSSMSSDKKNRESELLLRSASIDWDINFSVITAHEIIQSVLLHKHGLSRELIGQYEKFVETLFLPQKFIKNREKYLLFVEDYEKARNAFISLTDNALLKAWEFTLASLSEAKANVTKWNLYTSLGLQPSEPLGIGSAIHAHIQECVDDINKDLGALQTNYDHTFAQMRSLEIRSHHASSVNDIDWLRADYRVHSRELERILAESDELHDKGVKLSNAVNTIINFYTEKISNYFQEIYDAQMCDVVSNMYDDTPAGFRLLYKHGRSNPSAWTRIYSSEEYIKELIAFFSVTEFELKQLPDLKGYEREISKIVSSIISMIQSQEFMQASFNRLARAYDEPLPDDLELTKRKPWAYISGGTMGNLISCYYRRNEQPKETKRWVGSGNELFAFFIDMAKELPANVQDIYKKNKNYSILAFSPTHAFLCKPGLFSSAWDNDTYTYSWIRDSWYNPRIDFLNKSVLNISMIDFLISKIVLYFPSGYRTVVNKAFKNIPFSVCPDDFRKSILDALSYEKWLQNSRFIGYLTEEIDGMLHSLLPLVFDYEFKNRLHVIFENIAEAPEQIHELIDRLKLEKETMFSAIDLKDKAHDLLMTALQTTRSSIFFHKRILETMQDNGFALPEPMIVADANWENSMFGFTINPGNNNVEFWRFDDLGENGRPISQWRKYLDGREKKPWGFYTNPYEYGLSLIKF